MQEITLHCLNNIENSNVVRERYRTTCLLHMSKDLSKKFQRTINKMKS